MPLSPMKSSEHHILRGEANVYARDYAGAGPAFVLMHGFPDRLHMWGTEAPFNTFLGPLIGKSFSVQPSSGPAFVQMAVQFFDEQARNAMHLSELKALDVPVKLIWGQFNPYISVAVAERRQSQLKNASLTVVLAAHWLQCDEPGQVAKAMLS